MNDPGTQLAPAKHHAQRLLVVSLLASLLTFLIATLYPSGRPADEHTELSFRAAYLWIFAQAFWLTLPGLLLGLLVARVLPRTGSLLGAGVIFAAPILVLCDVLTFSWIGERFLSPTMQKVCTTLAPALATQIDASSVVDAVVTLGVAFALIVACWGLAGFAARRWARSPQAVGPIATLAVLVVLSLVSSAPAVWHLERTVQEMREHSARHPLCAFHVVGYRGVGVRLPGGEAATLPRLRGLQSAEDVYRIERVQETVAVDHTRLRSNLKRPRPNVAIIVAESIRPELVDPGIMPNLATFAEQSLHCRNHFSAGNSTTYGLFSLLNGLESVWFDRVCNGKPILTRVFHQAGFRTGFFGGDNWSHFLMDGYINPKHFDCFKTGEPDVLASDMRAIRETTDFLREGDPESPRLSITYLGATHSRYLSEPEDRIFQPAAPEDFVIPYSLAMQPEIYNRYKNSARTLDRLIKPLLRDDWLVIFLGDHGESFLEDGSAIHGLRLSKYQNMTPLVVHYPDAEPRNIDGLTMHADVLPTLLSMLEIPVTAPEVFSGMDLTSASPESLSERVFITGNFMDRTAGLIGPWTLDPQRPFAYRFLYRFDDWQLSYLNPVDELGYQCPDDAAGSQPSGEERVHGWIVEHIGAEAVREDRSAEELLDQFFSSSSRETRLAALKIASDIDDPDEKLFTLIAGATRDPDPEIRALAKDLVIRAHRAEGQR